MSKISIDIRSTKEEILERLEMLECIIALMPMNVYWMNTEGVYLGCNENEAKSIGLASRKDIVGKRNSDIPGFLIPEELDPVNKKVMQEGKTVVLEEPAVLRDGTKAIFLSSKAPLYNKEGDLTGMVGISVDITERKIMEIELKETRERLENVLDTIPGHVYWKDINGVYLGCNELQARDLGLTKEAVIGKTDQELIPKEEADRLREVDMEVLSERRPKVIEEIGNILGEQRTFLSKKVPLYDSPKSEAIGILGVSIDITEKKRAEQELFEVQNKLEGMTLVSASIAHELRTPLQSLALGIEGIRKYLPILLEAYSLAEEKGLLKQQIKKSTLSLLNDLCDTMDREINSSALTIDMLLMNLKTEVGNQQNLNEKFSISYCVEQALNRYPFSVKEKQLINWENNLNSDFLVRGSEILLSHVLFNLIKNALYYIAKAKKGSIMIWLEKLENNNYLFFKDTGTGIGEEMLPHLFEKFVSGTHHGAGIGLAFSKMVMESFGGEITCESKKGVYTLFKLVFPKTNREK